MLVFQKNKYLGSEQTPLVVKSSPAGGHFIGRCIIKWFKHDSDAHADAKLERILIKYGADGYAIYWYCLELIAAKVDKNHCTFELEHDAELIGHKLKIDTLRVEEIMRYMVSVDLFQINQETRRIMCLQLAKRLDEYSAKALPPAIVSRQCPDSVPTVSGLDKIRRDQDSVGKYSNGKIPIYISKGSDTSPDSVESDAPPPPSPKKEKEKKLGTEAKTCLDYYFQKHVEIREFEPTIAGPRDMAIFKRLLAGYSVEAIEQVIDFFFAYKQRSKFTTRALSNSFDTLYGVMLDKAKGKRK